jgi:uncharacterized protein (TIGR00369 family)
MDGNEKKGYLPVSKTCFVCGKDNPAGLSLRFYADGAVVRTSWRPADWHCGYAGVVHGGVIAAALDECMAWAATWHTRLMCVTGDLTVRYIAPLPSARELTVSAAVSVGGKRLVHVKGTIADSAGVEYAAAQGRFVTLTVKDTLAVDDELLYSGDELRLFDHLRAK